MAKQNQDYDNTNTGSIFVNTDKKRLAKERDTSNWPQGQGKLNVYGVDFYISAWTQTIKKGDRQGERFQSLTIKPVNEDEGKKLQEFLEGKASSSPKKKKGTVDIDEEFDDMDDDLPF